MYIGQNYSCFGPLSDINKICIYIKRFIENVTQYFVLLHQEHSILDSLNQTF